MKSYLPDPNVHVLPNLTAWQGVDDGGPHAGWVGVEGKRAGSGLAAAMPPPVTALMAAKSKAEERLRSEQEGGTKLPPSFKVMVI